jgi:hypothetical protein
VYERNPDVLVEECRAGPLTGVVPGALARYPSAPYSTMLVGITIWRGVIAWLRCRFSTRSQSSVIDVKCAPLQTPRLFVRRFACSAHATPRWAGVALPLGFVANVVGFSSGSSALLVGSYVVLTAAFVPVARALPRADATDDRAKAGTGLLPVVAGHTAG